jgi:hypothetical protein
VQRLFSGKDPAILSAQIDLIYHLFLLILDSKNLDDIYMRQGNNGGLTLFPNQIRGGNFNKDEFTFNSNVYIGTNTNDYKLKIFGNAEFTKNLNTSNIITSNININCNLTVESNGICEFKTDCYFRNNSLFNQINCENAITTESLKINGTFIYNGCNITFTTLYSAHKHSTTICPKKPKCLFVLSKQQE